MGLTLETGAGVTGANSYVDVDMAAAFLAARDIKAEGNISALLLRSMDVLNGYRYRGKKTNSAQALPFPRTGATDIDGEPYAANVIPEALKLGQLWMMFYMANGSSPDNVATPLVKIEEVDVLKIEYAVEAKNGGGVSALTIADLPNVMGAIRHLLYDESAALNGQDNQQAPQGFRGGVGRVV